MKYFQYIIYGVLSIILLFSSSCVSKKSMENCQIEKVSEVVLKNDDSYVMQVKFNSCTSKELRETLVKNELMNRFPLTKNRTVYVEEYAGKLYNEYRYGIKVE